LTAVIAGLKLGTSSLTLTANVVILNFSIAKRAVEDLERENVRLKRLVADLSLEKRVLKDVCFGKLVSPERRRQAVEGILEKYGVSERQACRIVGNPAEHSDTPCSSELMRIR
jgi:hypothetical protein